MNILSVEASTESCSAALYTEERIFVRHQIAPCEHSKLLLNMIDELLKEANLTVQALAAFAYGAGPGSFTGLRIAASMVQGLAFGVNKMVVPISTLQAMAQAAWQRFHYTSVFAALDARMGEIYYGFYELDPNNIMQSVSPDEIGAPNLLVALPKKISEKKWHGVGSGVAVYHEFFLKNLAWLELKETLLYPSALEVAILAQKVLSQNQGLAPETAIPVYLRNKVINKPNNLVKGIIKK
jgi:tRNA threonylcarbamoyladenosine biosynthesis protein TsaB